MRCTDVFAHPPPHAWQVRIEIVVSEFNPPGGTFRIGDDERRYVGWLELLGLLSRALEAEPPPEPLRGLPGQLGAGGQA